MSQQVYVLEDKNSGLLKIGISVDVAVRVGQVNKQFGCDAEVIGVLDVTDARKTERFIHGMLADCRVVGEWFEVDDSRQDYLFAYFDTPIPTRKRINHRGKTAATANGSGIRWKLAEFMNAHGVTRYALQKDSGVPMNTIRPMYAGTTARVDFSVLDRVVSTLRERTGKDVQLHDIIEWQPDATPEREA